MNTTTNDWEARINAAADVLELTPAEMTALMGHKDLGFTEAFHNKGKPSLDNEDHFKFGDFFEVLKDKYGKAQIRAAFAALKDNKSSKAPEPELDARAARLKALGVKVRIEDMDPADLLKEYLPDKPNDVVANALRKRFGDKPVLAYKDDGTLAIEEIISYASDREQGWPEQEAIMVDGKLAKLWPIGAKPDTMVEEDPLFPGQPLRNGRSQVNHRNWTGIHLAVRQLCRIIAERGDIDTSNREAVLRLLERAGAAPGGGENILKDLAEVYPEAELQYRELKARDELPKLKIPLGSSGNKPNNPFGVNRRS